MNQMSVSDRVTRVIAEQLGIDRAEVKPEKNGYGDLGCDSLDAIEIVMAIEEEFEIEIGDEDAEKMQSVADVIAYVEKATAATA